MAESRLYKPPLPDPPTVKLQKSVQGQKTLDRNKKNSVKRARRNAAKKLTVSLRTGFCSALTLRNEKKSATMSEACVEWTESWHCGLNCTLRWYKMHTELGIFSQVAHCPIKSSFGNSSFFWLTFQSAMWPLRAYDHRLPRSTQM